VTSTSPDEAPAKDAHNPRRNRLYNAHGVILRRRDVGESDRIVIVYTREFGKRSFSARGSRKTTSKIAGQIEPFSQVRLLVSRARSVDIISQAESVNAFPSLRLTEKTIATAGLIVELVDAMTPEEQPNKNVSELIVASLTLIDSGHDPGLVLVAFQLGLLRHLGYRPQLGRCSMCGSDLTPENQGFNLESGVVCPGCRRHAPESVAIRADTLKLMRAIDRGDLGVLLGLTLDPTLIAEADSILAAYTQRITGRPSRARDVFSDLRLE
jgi:DNA repair protein RecO (recombination protein O)